MPTSHNLLFWLEFYISLTFCYIAKARQEEDKVYFYLPTNFLHHYDIVNFCREKNTGSLLMDIIKNKMHRLSLKNTVQDNQDKLIYFLIGSIKSKSSFSLLSKVPDLCQSNPDAAERIVILVLVLLLNTGTKFVKNNHMNSMYKALMEIGCQESTPDTLANLLYPMNTISNPMQLLKHLFTFLKEYRNESLMCCFWDDLAAPPLQIVPLEQSEVDTHTFSSNSMQDTTDYNSTTEEPFEEVVKDFEEVDEFEKSELERKAREKQQEQEEEQKRNEAAVVIVKYFRNYIDKLKKERKPHQQFEPKHLFAPYRLTKSRCGICGVDLVVDGTEAVDGSQTKVEHESSQDHLSKVEQFEQFSQEYRSKILKNLQDITIFMEEYQVREDSAIYSNVEIDVKKMVNELSGFHTNLNELMMKRDWTNHIRVTVSFSMVQRTFDKSYKMFKNQFDESQRMDKQTSETQDSPMDDRLVNEQVWPESSPAYYYYSRGRRGRSYPRGQRGNYRGRGGNRYQRGGNW